ncbi:MAG: molybdopterin-dependent oxidoreductase, partial [Gemmatimonadales bacterium]
MSDKVDVRDRGPLPPGQVGTRKWPVLHYSNVPRVPTDTWTLRVFGAVRNPTTLSWTDFTTLPQRTVLCDMHCVTHWTRLDNEFRGVAVADLLQQA